MKKLLLYLFTLTLSIALLFTGSLSLDPLLVEARGQADLPEGWDGTVNSSWSGTAITSPADLAGFANAVNNGNTFAGKTITLSADINLDDQNWTPIGSESHPFCGTFDGQNHTIYNLSISAPDNPDMYIAGSLSNIGLFGFVGSSSSPGAVQNLILNTVHIYGDNYVGALIGGPTAATLSNISLQGKTVIVGNSYVGGLLGSYSGTGNNLEINSTFGWNTLCALRSFAGGIAGICSPGNTPAKLSNCSSNLGVYLDNQSSKNPGSFAGGITGVAGLNTSLINCSVNARIEMTGPGIDNVYAVGGLAGGYIFGAGSTISLSGSFTSTLFSPVSFDPVALESFNNQSLLGAPYQPEDSQAKPRAGKNWTQ